MVKARVDVFAAEQQTRLEQLSAAAFSFYLGIAFELLCSALSDHGESPLLTFRTEEVQATLLV
jgi:hypothetical protein